MVLQLGGILWAFAQVGLASFGGPAASIALMQTMFVRKHRWLTEEEFFDLVAASYLIPGPIAVQLSLHVGFRRAGLVGALAAVVGFVVPAAVITWICAVLYVHNQGLPQLEALMWGVRPAVLAVILVSLQQLSVGRLGRPINILLILGTATSYILGANPFLVLIVATLLFVILNRVISGRNSPPKKTELEEPPPSSEDKPGGVTSLVCPVGLFSLGLAAAVTSQQLNAWSLFLLFARVGLFLYGGGNVLAAYLTSDLVKPGVITQQLLLDALAVGTSTPGPILTVATFLGYYLGSHWGAVAATAGIITPCVVLASILHPYVRRARSYPQAATLLDGVSLAVIGLILGVCVELGLDVLSQPATVIFGLACLLATWKLKAPPVVVILGAALAGFLLSR